MKNKYTSIHSTIPFYLIIFIMLSNINIILTSFKCGFEQLQIEPQPMNFTIEDKKRRTDSSYQTIKIKVDYTALKREGSITDSDVNKVKNIIDSTISEFQKILKVRHVNLSLRNNQKKFIKNACDLNDDDLGSNYENYLIENDLVIFPSFNRRNKLGPNALAGACPCLYDSSNNRPTYGRLYINTNINFSKKNTEIYVKQILLHEITHILIFHPRILSKLGLIKNIDKIGYVVSPKVLAKAREHFNCETLTGLQLEDQGGSGSIGGHWEARFMLGDYMISTDYLDTVISDITLALFEDSGFYEVNYYSGGLFKFGKK